MPAKKAQKNEDEKEFEKMYAFEKSGSKFTIQNYGIETAEIIGPKGGKSVTVLQYDMEYYNEYLKWKQQSGKASAPELTA